MNLQAVDLNLLVVFDRLYAERGVSKAADRLGLSQPAVSNALARLRRLLGDELFLRTPRGMVPTPYAEQLAAAVADALALIDAGVNQPKIFHAATAKASMTIGMTDIGEIVFLPSLVQRLRREAPGVTLSTVRNAAVNLRDDMESGRVDLAIGLLPQLQAGFFQRRLFRQRYMCLFRRDHPLDRGRVTLAEYRAAEHLVVVSAGTGHGLVDEILRRAGIERQVRLTVPHFVAVGAILRQTDLVATVPEKLAQQLVEPFGLACAAHPVRLPDAAINAFWHARTHHSPAHRWLRGVVFDLFAER